MKKRVEVHFTAFEEKMIQAEAKRQGITRKTYVELAAITAAAKKRNLPRLAR